MCIKDDYTFSQAEITGGLLFEGTASKSRLKLPCVFQSYLLGCRVLESFGPVLVEREQELAAGAGVEVGESSGVR